MSLDSMLIELSSSPDRIDGFLSLLRPFGIIEATRSGVVAMPRDPIHFSQQEEQRNDGIAVGQVDPTMLPPG